MLIAAILFWTLLAVAQEPCKRVRANIPFPFQVEGTTLPAGQYEFCWNWNFSVTMKPMNAVLPSRYLRASAIDVSARPASAMLIFHEVANKYFLNEIHQPGTALVTMVVSSQEKGLPKMAVKDVEVEAKEGK